MEFILWIWYYGKLVKSWLLITSEVAALCALVIQPPYDSYQPKIDVLTNTRSCTGDWYASCNWGTARSVRVKDFVICKFLTQFSTWSRSRILAWKIAGKLQRNPDVAVAPPGKGPAPFWWWDAKKWGLVQQWKIARKMGPCATLKIGAWWKKFFHSFSSRFQILGDDDSQI